jgi:hypothetical protein
MSTSLMSHCLDYLHLFGLDPVTIVVWLVSFDIIVLNILPWTMTYAALIYNNLDSLWLKLCLYLPQQNTSTDNSFFERS